MKRERNVADITTVLGDLNVAHYTMGGRIGFAIARYAQSEMAQKVSSLKTLTRAGNALVREQEPKTGRTPNATCLFARKSVVFDSETKLLALFTSCLFCRFNHRIQERKEYFHGVPN